MADRIPFYEMFPGCRRFDGSLDALLQEAFVTSAVADREARTLELELRLTAPIPPVQDIPVTQDTLARFMTNVPDELKVYGDVFASLPHEILSSGLDIKKEDDQTPSEP